MLLHQALEKKSKSSYVVCGIIIQLVLFLNISQALLLKYWALLARKRERSRANLKVSSRSSGIPVIR